MTKSPYFFDTQEIPDFPSLCACFTGKSLQSPHRSTVPLLSLVRHSQPQWNALLDSWRAPHQARVHFEYCVASPKRGGHASQTDALLVSDSTVWAVEAKWREPRYETVAERLSKPEDDGADPRGTLNGWMRHLQPFTTRTLQIDVFADVVYQVLHRAASACAVATAQKLSPELVYLHFHPFQLKNSATTAQYVSDLAHLHALLGSPAGFVFRVVELPLRPTAAFESIKGSDKHSPATSARVAEALCHEPLFTFGTPTSKRI
jgi:hypothetical protein